MIDTVTRQNLQKSYEPEKKVLATVLSLLGNLAEKIQNRKKTTFVFINIIRDQVLVKLVYVFFLKK